MYKLLNKVTICARYPFRILTKFSQEKLENLSKNLFEIF